MSNKILITGGAGYIGIELTKYLLKKKYKIIVLDRFFFNNVENYIKHPNLKVIKDDTRKIKNKYFRGIDIVIDLVALAIAPHGSKFYDEMTMSINFKSRLQNAKLAKKNGVKRYIFSSSCSVYGFQKIKICHEESQLNPQSTYAISKVRCEKKILPLGTNNFCVTALRLPTVFGLSNKMRFDIIVNGMTFDALTIGKINLLRNGKQRRPFLHIKDACRAFDYFINFDVSKINKQIINIGDEKNNIYLLNLVKLIFKTLGKKNKINWYGLKDDRSYFVSFKKMRRLSFKCKYDLEYGITELKKAYKKGKLFKTPETISINWFDELIKWEKIINNIKMYNGVLKIK